MINFRPAMISDSEVIADFNCRLALETEQKTLDSSTVREGVLRGLKLAPEVRYFVATIDDAVVGQIMLTREWSDWRNGWMVWLQSVYVRSDCRGAGIFRGLLEYSMEQVKSEGNVVNARLYVEYANDAAKATYRKIGFVDAGYEVMEMPLTTY